ncbi:predicted protein [Chaetoceros tenuissimus]|uniref:Uncharacterized protein n=1 Tax=Chaetoceros tenuissimus TaxID=426638 RepID=A0AAD3HDE3_9STRA|nr:predicted protein [Chaetoceros tenuissimus]
MNSYIGRRALSSGGGTLLKRERTAVKKHTESFESHLNSATTKHRIQDNHHGRSVPQDAVESGVFVNAGRLKRETVVSNTQGATEINRMGGRIIRSNERTGTGGSVVNQASATSIHRRDRIDPPKDLNINNPSNISIPIGSKSNDAAKISASKDTSGETAVEKKSEGSIVGKVLIFIAGAGAAAFTAFFSPIMQ